MLGDLRSQRHTTSYFHTVINNNLQGTRNDEEEATLETQTLGSYNLNMVIGVEELANLLRQCSCKTGATNVKIITKYPTNIPTD
jgi:hypothetical protein